MMHGHWLGTTGLMLGHHRHFRISNFHLKCKQNGKRKHLKEMTTLKNYKT